MKFSPRKTHQDQLHNFLANFWENNESKTVSPICVNLMFFCLFKLKHISMILTSKPVSNRSLTLLFKHQTQIIYPHVSMLADWMNPHDLCCSFWGWTGFCLLFLHSEHIFCYSPTTSKFPHVIQPLCCCKLLGIVSLRVEQFARPRYRRGFPLIYDTLFCWHACIHI